MFLAARKLGRKQKIVLVPIFTQSKASKATKETLATQATAPRAYAYAHLSIGEVS